MENSMGHFILFFKKFVYEVALVSTLSYNFIPTLEKCELINRHGCATSIHAFNATIYHIHPIFLYVHPTDDKLQENSKSAWIKI